MTVILDVRRLLCPLPVIRVQDKIQELNNGDILQVICTDPGVKHDIPAWCRIHGHSLQSIEDHEKEILITIRVVRKI